MALAGDGGLLVPAPRCEGWPGGPWAAAEVDERTDNTWMRGIEFEQELCITGAPAVVSMQCPPPFEQLSKNATRGFDVEYADPFVVYAGYDCSTGGTPVEEAWVHAENIFDAGWKRAFEHALWTGGDQDGNTFRMSLAHGGAVDLNPAGAVELVTGISLLEGYMAGHTTCLATIHGSVRLAAYLSEKAQVHQDPGDGLRTRAGSRVALGAGYPLSGPSNVAAVAGTAWLFASGPVRIVTGPKMFIPAKGDLAAAVDRSVNDVQVFVEKGFAVELGCGLAAVRVNLTGLM